jgi:hypothetical protein
MSSIERVLAQPPSQPTELATRPPGHLANPADFANDDLGEEDVGDVVLKDVTYFENEDYETVELEDLDPQTGNALVPAGRNPGGQGSQEQSNMSMNMLGNLNINVIQPSMNMLRTRVGRPAQPRPQETPREEPTPEYSREPDDNFNMRFHKPRPDPKRKFFIGGMGVMMASLVTTSGLYGSCAAKQGKATGRHTTSHTPIMSTPTVTSILTSTSKSTATSVSTTSVTITPSASRTTQSSTTTTTTSLPPTTVTFSTVSSTTLTEIQTVTPQPIVVTNTVVVTPAPVTVSKTRTCYFICL